MDRAINDATLIKAGDIFQYYIALRDCFEMKTGDKLQIEVNGDVSLIEGSFKRSYQKEVKHHFGENNLSDRDEDFWKTLSNWYVDYDRIFSFSNLILHTTANILSESPFNNWNSEKAKNKLIKLQSIGAITKKREANFRKYYNRIFDETLYNEERLVNILERFTIESSQVKITGVSSEFSCYIGYIPEKNRDNYIAALLGRILSIIKNPPHRWEVTREEFDLMLQQESPAYLNPIQKPLPTDFAEMDIPDQSVEILLQKNFVEAIKKIEYDKQIPYALSDYWKAVMTIGRYFKDDLLYLESLLRYENELEKKLKYTKDGKEIETEGMDRMEKIKQSKLMYISVMGWDAKDFESIIRNQGYFQRGIIHNIVEERKFSWDVGESDEY